MHAGAREMKRTKKRPFDGREPWFLDDGPPRMTAAAILEARRGQSVSAPHTALMREQKAVNDAATRRVFDAAVAAEAKRLDNKTLAISAEFADAVGPGLKARI
jgi:hypothetical protein